MTRPYKTSQQQRQWAKQRRDAIKAAGGLEYQRLLEKERAQIRERRLRNGRQPYDDDRKTSRPFKTHLCLRARQRGRERGLEATITPTDIFWPSHCPVLGLELDYPARSGQRGDSRSQPNWPTLDRWDNTKGYVPGNVFVISYRANTLKSSVSKDEILQIAKYVMNKPTYKKTGALPQFGELINQLV